MTTAYTAVDVMGTSPDSDCTAFINPTLPLIGVPWRHGYRTKDQKLGNDH